jgi:elongator complex protein 3
MLKHYDNFIKLATKETLKDSEAFLRLKKSLCQKLKLPLPTNADLREVYERMIKEKVISRNLTLEKAMMTRKIRTESGVAVVAVLTKDYPCPGKCLYCPTEKDMPKSYLSNEPAVMRAIHANFDPYIQVQSRLHALELNGHKTDKIELIIMGGTFSCLPKDYQMWFIDECFRAANDYPRSFSPLSKGPIKLSFVAGKAKDGFLNNQLSFQQKRNEKTGHRIVGLTLETRPDYIDEKEITNFRKLGCTRVELGVQSIFDDVLKINRRGHTIEATIKATKILKNAGFKINYHIMPGLPGSDLKKDYKMFKVLFSNPDFQPDILKIYPTVVVKNSDLYKLWKEGKYSPLTDKQFEKFILKVKNNLVPPYVRIMRLVRDVPASSIVAGPIISNIRQLIVKNSQCQCIRCREVRSDYQKKEKIILDRIDYPASEGKEIFLQFVSQDKKKLFALLRLRIPGAETHCNATLLGAALIREVHTYGKMTEISKNDKNSPQHEGLGKKLIIEAERIAKVEFGLKKIVVISGVGVRGYYRKLGYRLRDTYMVKSI